MRLKRLPGPTKSLMMSVSEEQPLQEEKTKPSFFVVHIKLIARTFGMLTVVILWVSTVVTLEHNENEYMGWYLIPAALIVTFFEITWILNKSACCGREGCCCQVWRAIMWIDNWKKFVLYLLVSVPLFLEGMDEALGIVSGFLMILLSMLYLVKTFLSNASSVKYEKTDRRVVPSKTPPISVVAHEISTQTDADPFEDYLDSGVTQEEDGHGEDNSQTP